jgi:hypothetical protein
VSDPTQQHGADYDPIIVEYVENIRDRFGQHGLEGMIVLARQELDRTLQAMRTIQHDDSL